MSSIKFESTIFNIDKWTLLKVPPVASDKLPSRGQVMVEGTINGHKFQAALEPDGKASHWLNIDAELSKLTGLKAGDTANIEMEVSKVWPEPVVPQDILDALSADQKAHDLWVAGTPMARWDWIRWIGGTKNEATRSHRIEVAMSKMDRGERRPCCFNRGMCMVPAVSKNGVLLDPAAK